jgi:hypothetical protein
MKKITSLDGPGDPAPGQVADGTSEPPQNGKPGARKAATPKPSPKQGEWMLKGYKNPLDPPKK